MTAASLLAQAPKPSATAMPDFNGIWQSKLTGIARAYGKPLPFTPFGEERYKAQDVLKDPVGICLPAGPVRAATGSPHPFQIIQTKDMLAMLYEYQGVYRMIYTDGRKAPEDIEDYPEWMGFSTGHYEGDTLVVETVGINARNWLDAKMEHSEKLRLNERFRKTDDNTFSWIVTYTDPVYFQEPITINYTIRRSKAGERIMSYSCSDDTSNAANFESNKK